MARVKYLKADEEAGKKAGDFGYLQWDAMQAAIEGGMVEAANEVKEEDLDKLDPGDSGEVRGSTQQLVYDLTGAEGGGVLAPSPERTTRIGGVPGGAPAAPGGAPVAASRGGGDEYDVMTRAELDKEAQKRGMNVSSAKTRDDVIKALRAG